MLTPEQAALEIRAFAKDETGLGNVKSAWAALDVIKKYVATDAQPATDDVIYGSLFWQHLNLLYKQAFTRLNIIERYRLKMFTKALAQTAQEWRMK